MMWPVLRECRTEREWEGNMERQIEVWKEIERGCIPSWQPILYHFDSSVTDWWRNHNMDMRYLHKAATFIHSHILPTEHIMPKHLIKHVVRTRILNASIYMPSLCWDCCVWMIIMILWDHFGLFAVFSWKIHGTHLILLLSDVIFPPLLYFERSWKYHLFYIYSSLIYYYFLVVIAQWQYGLLRWWWFSGSIPCPCTLHVEMSLGQTLNPKFSPVAVPHGMWIYEWL